jgi:steroid delta-isomerase-like uncharacterized protein
MQSANAAIVERFYRELWNRWDLAAADEIVAEDVRFRGSLGTTARGRDAFKAYVETVRAAFPDWHNEIDELLEIGDRVVARLTWTGTHTGGPLMGVEPAGTRVSYVGAAFFRLAEGRITEAWIVGDTQALWSALRAAPARG